MKIANYAHKVIKDGPKNGLDGLLPNENDMSTLFNDTIDINIIEGQLFILNEVHDTCLDAIEAALAHVPTDDFAMIFVNTTGIRDPPLKDFKKAFMSREDPIVFTGSFDEVIFRNWLCYPRSRGSDLFLVDINSKINGIETDIVVYVFPEKCKFCQVSNEDPVIISRAKAMLIVSTYTRSTHSTCTCKYSSIQTLNSLTTNSIDSLRASQHTLTSSIEISEG